MKKSSWGHSPHAYGSYGSTGRANAKKGEDDRGQKDISSLLTVVVHISSSCVCGRAIGLANLDACLGYRYIYFVSFLFESGWLYYKKSFVSLDRIGV